MSPTCMCLGCGAGFSGDREDQSASVVRTLARSNKPSAVIFETLAERTLAQAQLDRRKDPDKGFEPYLESYLAPVLSQCLESNISIIGNFGAANPEGAARCIQSMAASLGCPPGRIGIVEGDNLLEAISPQTIRHWETEPQMKGSGRDIISANVYFGAEPIVTALDQGASVVVTGRVADAALGLGPLVHHFGWAWDDWDKLALGVLAGHILECSAQVTGGYFAEPGFKDIPDMVSVGFPIVEVWEDGTLVVTKAADTGGRVTEQTVKEQLLYEIHDPSAYLNPDVVMDLSDVFVEEIESNRIKVAGVRGKPRPETLKTFIGVEGGWLGEAEISYAGPGAESRARFAVEILRKRFQLREYPVGYRLDIIGVSSVFNDDAGVCLDSFQGREVQDVRVRLAVQAEEEALAQRAIREVLSLYTCGPGGGGGVRQHVTHRLQTVSGLVRRDLVVPRVRILQDQGR